MEDIEALKKCNVCQEEKPVSNFYFRKEMGKYRDNCKKCKPLMSKGDLIAKAHAPTKVCKDCGIEKPSSEFGRAGKGGVWMQPYCKPCDAIRKKNHADINKDAYQKNRKEYYSTNKELIAKKAREYYDSNKDKILQYHKDYESKNSDYVKARGKKYRQENSNVLKEKYKKKRDDNIEYYRKKEKEWRDKRSPEQKAKALELSKKWAENNKERVKELYERRRHIKREQRRIWCNNKSATDIGFRILKNLRSRTRFALKRDKTVKSDTTVNLLGCSIEYFKIYFTSKFHKGMSWEDFMNGDIHIDHVKPCSKFDLTNPEEQKLCFHFSNLQPLWWYDNLAKSDNYEEKAA